MSISYFNLLLLLSAPWMGNAMSAESAEPVSRDSRQMMFPIGVVPWQQPNDFYNYGTIINHLHPAIKHRLLEALITATERASENPSLPPSYKAGAEPNKMEPLNLDPNASDDELFERVSHLLPYSKEELKEMQSRMGIEAVIGIIVQALIGQLVSVVLFPFIMSIITGMLAG